MKLPLVVFALVSLASVPVAHAGEAMSAKETVPPPAPREDWSRLELAFESGLGFGLNNPSDYQTAPQLLTLRYAPLAPFRLGSLRLLHQFSVNAAAVDFYHNRRDYNDSRRGETFYFGGGVGARLVLSKPGFPLELSIDGRFFVGDIDSQGPPFGQGQDLTFTAIVTGGVAYRVTPHLKFGAAFFYEHFSNGGLSEPEVPNIGLDTIGPMLSVTYSF